jgi:hypothetical protein
MNQATNDRYWVACHYEKSELRIFGPYSATEVQAFVEGLEFGSDTVSHLAVQDIADAVKWWRANGCDEQEILDEIADFQPEREE